ncbi:hypothetical protein PSAB6_300017 [Paraburkholderia sabiae]|nr:hypothetical protein PSAB6_300017 [Paraburkholderia sabiae]
MRGSKRGSRSGVSCGAFRRTESAASRRAADVSGFAVMPQCLAWSNERANEAHVTVPASVAFSASTQVLQLDCAVPLRAVPRVASAARVAACPNAGHACCFARSSTSGSARWLT